MSEHKWAPPPEFPTDREGNPVNLLPDEPVLRMTAGAQERRMLKVEALRAAVELAKAVNHDRRECVERTMNTADQFLTWLEGK